MSTNKELEIFLANMNDARDVPDARDIMADELFGAPVFEWMPASASVDLIAPLNQGWIGACTVFGSLGGLFNTMKFDADRGGYDFVQPVDPWDVWAKAKLRGASDKNGWSVQGAMKLEKDMNLSKGYAAVGYSGNAMSEILKYWIWQGRAITTGSTYGDWWKIINTGIYSESSKSQGHCWQFSKFDDNQKIGDDVGGFYSPNSWLGRGAFWMSYRMANRLFTQYIALGPTDLAALKNLQNKRTQEYLVKSAAVWNKKNPEDIATPYEIATMVNRALNFVGNQKRKRYIATFEDKILRGAGVLAISNGSEPERMAKDLEIAVMFTNAVTREAFTQLKLTRLQVATVIGRDLL